MFRIRIRRCISPLLSLCAALALAPAAIAQSTTTGTIHGRVTDSTGAIVPGADVSVVNVEKGLVTHLTTGADGEYTALALPPGHYTVTAAHGGFSPSEAKPFRLYIDQI